MEITRSILVGDEAGPECEVSIKTEPSDDVVQIDITDHAGYGSEADNPPVTTIVLMMVKADAEALGRLLLDASSDG